MERLKNKTALITAAAQGIGRASAEMFIKEGAKVIAVDINQQTLSSLKNAELKVVDVTDPKAVQNLAEEIRNIDVLFNCAGYVHQGNLFECEEKDLDFSWQLNVKSMYFMIQAFLPAMMASQKGASIINMASVASNIKGVANRFAYTTTKAAVIGLTKSIATDFIKDKIRCNAIAPGTVESPSLDERIKALGDYETIKQDFINRQPMGRIGTAQEVAYLALYLASDESAYTTGAIEIIDGGWTV